MLPFQTKIRSRLLPYSYYPLFAVVALYGVAAFFSWKVGSTALVQPRAYDAPLSANACICFGLLGCIPLGIGLGWRRIAIVLGLLGTLLAGATLIQGLANIDFGIDHWFVKPDAVIASPTAAHMPIALAFVLTSGGLFLTWLAAHPPSTLRPILLALLGSLSAAYGLTGLFGYRTGLNSVEFWLAYARLGPHTAVLLVFFGVALLLLAARETPDWLGAGPRWIWLPVVMCGVTITVTFWIALQQRELTFTNSSTQLAIDNVAALFKAETENQIESLSRLAQRWNRLPALAQGDWENETAEFLSDFSSFRSVHWVDANLHTRWFWPLKTNEETPLFDHGGSPLRREAIAEAAKTLRFALAAPLESPQHPPSFAIYVPLVHDGSPTGFIAGEVFYRNLFETIVRRLNLSRRYALTVRVYRPPAASGNLDLLVYDSGSFTEKRDRRLRLSADYTIFDQRLSLVLEPQPAYLEANRQFLPEVALVSGLGVSLLIGLVINLAQSALRRQRVAERTTAQLTLENEERRRVEARLTATDERLNLAFESTQVGVYEWDLETDEVHCTPSIWKMTGYDPSCMPATGQAWIDLLRVDERPAVRAAIDAHCRGETPFIELEQRVQHQSGDWFWIALRAKCTAFTAARQPRRILGTLQNINDRKRADEALRASQAVSRKLSLVASKTDNAVIITDQIGRIEWANESYSRLTGRHLGDVSGHPLVGHLTGPEQDPAAITRLTAALASRDPIAIDVVQLSVDNRSFHVRLDVQPVFNEDGQVENFIAIETDITARVETEQQLRRAKTEADAASRAKSEFLAAMSHEIRTPMNGVIGMTSLLLETNLSSEQRDYVSTIRTSGDALLSIINEILDFSKIESGKLELENQPFELTQCVEEAVDIFAGPAIAKNIELAYSIDPAVPSCVLGDITRLRQVLVCLVNNAVKFTASGFVTIEVSTPSDTSDLEVSEKIVLDFYVTDTGIGIPPDRIGQLFKPFSQLDGSSTRRYGGTGLGLAICDRLSQLMGGKIDVQSTPGKGSRFHFSIVAQPVVVVDGSTPPLFVGLPTGAVLAVDDHPVNRTMLNRCLSRWKVKPLVAADSAAALRLAADEKTPLIAAVIDQNLGSESGLELAAKLRALYRKLPIIILTPPNADPRAVPNTDPFIFQLAKPIKPYPLHDTLRLVIAESKARPPTEPPIPAPTLLGHSIPLDLLLVEDNPVNQKVALRYLERLGYRARAVSNGFEAVQAVRGKKYDLVFMDLQMPEMDGLTATREIRAQIAKDQQPIIVALTANAMQGDRERCLEAGMNDYVTKPVKSEDLVAAITRHFGVKAG